jgi:hypothetical protein
MNKMKDPSVYLILHVSVAPPGLAFLLWRFPGFPSVIPGWLTSCAAPYCRPSGAENPRKFDFLESFKTPILHVSVAPPGLAFLLWRFPGVPFGHPRLAYKPAQHLTVAPPGAENPRKFDFLESQERDEESRSVCPQILLKRLIFSRILKNAFLFPFSLEAHPGTLYGGCWRSVQGLCTPCFLYITTGGI